MKVTFDTDPIIFYFKSDKGERDYSQLRAAELDKLRFQRRIKQFEKEYNRIKQRTSPYKQSFHRLDTKRQHVLHDVTQQ